MAVTPVLPNVGQYESYLVEMTIMLLVTDAAIPGMSYKVTIPDTLARYPQYLPSISASINVLPREDLHGGGGESEPNSQSSPEGVSVDGFEGYVIAGQSLLFSIPYNAPRRTSVYDVAIYAQTSRSTLPQTFRLTLPRSAPEGTMIRVCVQVSYLYGDEELGKDYFYSRLWYEYPDPVSLP